VKLKSILIFETVCRFCFRLSSMSEGYCTGSPKLIWYSVNIRTLL
jgi:hypothetical protein